MHGMEQGGGLFVCFFSTIVGLIGLLFFVFWLWMLIDCVKNCPSENNLRLIWILVIIFTGFIGAAIYYFVQRPKNPPAVA